MSSGFFPFSKAKNIGSPGFFGPAAPAGTSLQTLAFNLQPPGDSSTGPFGTGTSEGWQTSSATFFPSPLQNPVGNVIPGIPFLKGIEIGMVMFIQDGGNTENIFMVGTQTQNFFFSWHFKNRLNVTETYLTSAATFDTATFPGFSWWHWPALQTFPYLGLSNVPITILY